MTNDLAAAVAEIKRITPKDDPWNGDDLSQAQPSYAPSETDSAIATILNAVASGAMVPAADVQGLVDATKPLAAMAERYDPPEDDDGMACWSGLAVPKIGHLRRLRSALAAWENRNG